MRSIVLVTGGLAKLKDEPRVQMIFIYLSFDTLPDYLPLPVTDPIRSTEEGEIMSKLLYQNSKDLAEVTVFIHDTVVFLQRIQALSGRGWALSLSTSTGDFNPFGPTTLFYHLLSPRWLPPFNPSASVLPTTPKQGVLGQHRTTRMACLLLLCEALLALHAPSKACDDYMLQQVDAILVERADEKPDLRPFLHLLMKDTRGVRLRDLDVAYDASKNAQIIKRLSIPIQDKVGQLLLGCLAGESSSAESLSREDFERIRDEALYFEPP